jgi:hypothetical protein
VSWSGSARHSGGHVTAGVETARSPGGSSVWDRQRVVAHWQARKSEWGRLRIAVDGEALCGEFLAQLEQLWTFEDSTEVDLYDAAHVSGYSPDHLRRLHRKGELPAVKRGRRYYFRVADLPRKPRRVDHVDGSGYDPEADARRVAVRRNGENSHGTQAAT